MKNYACSLQRTCDKHIDPILTNMCTGRHCLLCLAFCFAYFHPVDQGNWYRGHCTENYCASPKAILTLHKMFVRDWCETILTYFGYPMKRRNCAKQQGDARNLEAHSSRMYIWKSNSNDNGSRRLSHINLGLLVILNIIVIGFFLTRKITVSLR